MPRSHVRLHHDLHCVYNLHRRGNKQVSLRKLNRYIIRLKSESYAFWLELKEPLFLGCSVRWFESWLLEICECTKNSFAYRFDFTAFTCTCTCVSFIYVLLTKISQCKTQTSGCRLRTLGVKSSWQCRPRVKCLLQTIDVNNWIVSSFPSLTAKPERLLSQRGVVVRLTTEQNFTVISLNSPVYSHK